jgi:uncharacterized protein YkwD
MEARDRRDQRNWSRRDFKDPIGNSDDSWTAATIVEATVMGRVSRVVRCVAPGVTIALALWSFACVAPSPPPPPRRGSSPGSLALESAAPPVDLAGTITELVAAHNRVRETHGRTVLTVSSQLEAAASEHALDMARHHWMSHRGSDFSSPFRRMTSHGYKFHRAGENVAAGQRSVEAVMRSWMLSPGHRANILGRYTQIGAACATATNGTLYWCVTFGDPDPR